MGRALLTCGCVIWLSCSAKPADPVLTAKTFVAFYFDPTRREDLKELVVEKARLKVDLMTQSDIPVESAFESPAGYFLLDSAILDSNHFQFDFSVYYTGHLAKKEIMQIYTLRFGNDWKVYDFRFTTEN